VELYNKKSVLGAVSNTQDKIPQELSGRRNFASLVGPPINVAPQLDEELSVGWTYLLQQRKAFSTADIIWLRLLLVADNTLGHDPSFSFF